jgi:hypothetical protein
MTAANISAESHKTTFPRRRRAPLLSPTLLKALKDLAESEGLPLPTFVTLLIRDGLMRRSRS